MNTPTHDDNPTPRGPRALKLENQLPEPIEKALDWQMRPGSLVVAEGDGRRYRISSNLGTLERDTKKRCGKAARRADKRARRLAREQAARAICSSTPTASND
jgi:hypothetical protein